MKLIVQTGVPNWVPEKDYVSRLTSILIKYLKRDFEIIMKVTVAMEFKKKK
jgi:hypothetical protein